MLLHLFFVFYAVERLSRSIETEPYPLSILVIVVVVVVITLPLPRVGGTA